MRKTISIIFIIGVMLLLCACGGGSSAMPDEMVGHWSDGKTYSTFPISSFDISNDGSITIDYAGREIIGKISGSNGKYEITVEEGTGTMSDFTANEVKSGLKITAEMNPDNTLTVYIKAKSGYYYVGPDSEVYSK
ncbi:MAG: hypothetical protein IJH45_01850 [Firmicutes bacterium]|nr:hypothetical protein [Bacillota bacterium]MBR0375296.1 hypothetical protein [Bacillota bacterium]